MNYLVTTKPIGTASRLIFGQFLEHFHRQVYDGVFDPKSPLSDEDGLRTDVLEAMRELQIPIIRWPGGCFVSTYNWKKAVGPNRIPAFDKAWRVEDPNTFGTDEFIKLCRKIECEPYICTNAGSGTPEEMSDWVEYCNLENEGEFAKMRIANGYSKPHNVKYWSIGNENYGEWELGAKSTAEWGRFVKESAKMIHHVDPMIELTAAALTDIHWNVELLEQASRYLKWISIHEYWDGIWQTNQLATYEESMAYTNNLNLSVTKVRGLLTAMGLEKNIKIAFDEWNLRAWYHPNMHQLPYGVGKENYLYPRDDNDINSSYTMADAVFSACFLHMCMRNCDIVGMANFAPVINTRGCIYTHKEGIVKRSTFYVFQIYQKYLGETVLNCVEDTKSSVYTVYNKEGTAVDINPVDLIFTMKEDGTLAVGAVNKHKDEAQTVTIKFLEEKKYSKAVIHTINGITADAYNDIDLEQVGVTTTSFALNIGENGYSFILQPHSVNVIELS